MTETAMNGNRSVASVHLVLHGKLGVGKSFVDAVLARPASNALSLVEVRSNVLGTPWGDSWASLEAGFYEA